MGWQRSPGPFVIFAVLSGRSLVLSARTAPQAGYPEVRAERRFPVEGEA
jgi:uncharacterized protein YceK